MNLVKKRCAYLIICLIMVFVCPTYQVFGMNFPDDDGATNKTYVGYYAGYRDEGRIIIDSGDEAETPSVIGPSKPIEDEKEDETKPDKPGFLVDTGDIYGGISVLSLSVLSVPMILILKKITEKKDYEDDELEVAY